MNAIDSKVQVTDNSLVKSESSIPTSSQRAPDNDILSKKMLLDSYVSLPILPDRVDFAIGTVAPEHLLDITSGKAAVILVSDKDCSLCEEIHSSLSAMIKSFDLPLIVAEKELASVANPEDNVFLQFVSADGIIVGREVPSQDGTFDNSRIRWLASATQSIGSVASASVKISDESQDKFVGVTDQAVSLFSSDTGKPTEKIASGEKFEGAWSLGSNVYGISECCEPAAGRLWLVDSGKQIDRDLPAFDAISARRSADDNWILTISSRINIWPSVKPFSSNPTEVLPPGSPPVTVEWLHDRFGLAALWSESNTREQAALETIGLSRDLQIATRHVIAVPSATVGIAPLNNGTIVLAINGTNPSLSLLYPISGDIEKLRTLPDKIKSTSLSPSGHKLLVQTDKGRAIVFDTSNWTEQISVLGPFKSANW